MLVPFLFGRPFTAVLKISFFGFDIHEGVYSFKGDTFTLETGDVVGRVDDIAAEVDGVAHEETGERGVGVAAEEAVPD